MLPNQKRLNLSVRQVCESFRRVHLSGISMSGDYVSEFETSATMKTFHDCRRHSDYHVCTDDP